MRLTASLLLSSMLSLTLMACAENTSADEKTADATPQKAEPVKVAQAATDKKADDKQTEKAEPSITTTDLGNGFYMLNGPGGNIGVSIGDDGVFVIDDKFDRFGEEIIASIKALSDKPIRYVLNTHYHGDHTGANAKMKSTGATIVAHDNVRARMQITFDNKLFGRPVKATPADQWPVMTYSENATFHINDQTVKAVYTPAAHTDGDSIVYFQEGDVLHMGDNFFNGNFPYIDIDGGGSIKGMIAAHDVALAMITDETTIIPGHGPLATRSDLVGARDMLKDISARVQSRIDENQDIDAIISDNPLAGLGNEGWFINEETMARIAYRSLTES